MDEKDYVTTEFPVISISNINAEYYVLQLREERDGKTRQLSIRGKDNTTDIDTETLLKLLDAFERVKNEHPDAWEILENSGISFTTQGESQ